MKLTLRVKGLILVMIPLLCGISYLSLLYWLLQRAELEERKATHARLVMYEANNLVRLLYDAGISLFSYGMTQSRKYERSYDAICRKIPDKAAVLRRLVSESADKKESLARLQRLTNQSIELLVRCKQSIDEKHNGGQGGDSLLLKMELEYNLSHLFDEIKSFTEGEALAGQIDPGAESRLREWISLLIVFGLISSVVVALLSANYFSNQIVQRVNIMVENTGRLLREEELNRYVSGNDEISHLDKVFHKVTAELRQTAARKREIMSMVSHDLRSPLSSMSMSLEMLTAGVRGPLPKPVERDLENVREINSRLIRMINDLLDIDKIEAGKFDVLLEHLPLDPIVEKSVAALSAMARRRNISVSIERSGLNVIADEERLIQVLTNLLSNAIKYSPVGGEIKITGCVAGEMAEVTVSDQGRGIPAADLSRVFERFEQVGDGTPRQGTSGLGLAICRSIIDKHHGTIGVRSVEGQGSHFWFKLPLAPEED